MIENATWLKPKQRFTFPQAYMVTVKALRSMPDFMKVRHAMGAPFVERIMLAVTEVNGCPACAYEHTKLALRAGMKPEDVRQFLSGQYEGAPDDELSALMFAQHYADSRGNPDAVSWAAIEKEYGPKLARGILGAIRSIMWGNVVGLAFSGLQAKIKGEPLAGSWAPRDVAMMAFSVLDIPPAAIQAALSNLLRRPLV